MVAEIPIVHAYSGQGDPVKKYEIGISVEAGDPQELTRAILLMYNMPSVERVRIGRRARTVALEHFSCENLTSKLEAAIFSDAISRKYN